MKKIKSILLLVVLFMLSTGVFGQGLYENQENSSSDASMYSSSSEKPQLRAGGTPPPGGEDGKEAGTPIGSGVLILMILSGIYLSKTYYDTKKKKA